MRREYSSSAAWWSRPAGAAAGIDKGGNSGNSGNPPPNPGPSPVNPFALAELLAGAPVPAGEAGEAMISRVLGAPLSALLEPGSVLYRPSTFVKDAKGATKPTKSAGAPLPATKISAAKARLLSEFPVSLAIPSQVSKAPPVAPDPEPDWLRAAGYTCAEWSRLSARDRLSAVAGLPEAPPASDAVARLNAWCERNTSPGFVPTGDTEYRDMGIPGRIAERLGFRADRHDPAACAAWMALSRDEQIARIQRAFPLELAAIRRGEGIVNGISQSPTNPDFSRIVAYLIQTYGLATGMSASIAERMAIAHLAADRYFACDGPEPPGSNFELEVPGGRMRSAWVKLGDFLPSGGLPSVLDPMQGVVGDCYLLSSLSGLVWAMPNALDRLVGRSGDRFTVTLRNQAVSVSGRVPCIIENGYFPIFCRPDRPGAWWPAVLEKAWAEWVTGDTTDRPDITQLDAEDPSSAARRRTAHTYLGIPMINPMVDLLGAYPFWNQLATRSGQSCFDLVNEFCTNGRADRGILLGGTVTAPDRPYGMVSNHAYTVLGTLTGTDGRRAIVVRNPWGRYVPRRAANPGAVVPFNGRWNGLDVSGEYHGVTALDAGFFANVFNWLYGVRL